MYAVLHMWIWIFTMIRILFLCNNNVVFYSLTGGNDYVSIANLLLTFDSVTTTIDVPVNITDDTVFELTESFIATLSFPGAPPTGVILDPDSAQTTIIDDDGWCSLA